MHFLYADSRRNRLHQILFGTLNRGGATVLLRDAAEQSPRLRPGFEIISDLRDLRPVEDSAENDVRLMMERCAAHSPSLLIRVPRSTSANFGFTIMSYFHYPRSIRMVTCGSLEEAAALLAPESSA